LREIEENLEELEAQLSALLKKRNSEELSLDRGH
jgi:hypothetical protein